MAKRNVQLVQDSVNGLETSNGINVAQVTGAVTDNAIARFDGTTGAIQNSSVVVDDSGNVGIGTSSPFSFADGVTRLTVSGTSGSTLLFEDTGYEGTGDGVGRFDYDNGSLAWLTGSRNGTSTTSSTERMRIDSSGNIGVGVTPSAWSSTYKALEIGSSIGLYAMGAGDRSGLNSNAYYNGTNWIYKGSRNATRVEHYDGAFNWYTAPSGTAGNTVAWTTGLTVPLGGGIQLPNTAIANATTLDWYEEATATLTATGMTTTPTGTGRFTRNGDTVTALIPTISGTSNATTFTLTGIPTNFRPVVDRNVFISVSDNGGVANISVGTIRTAGTFSLFSTVAGGPFTASGTKSVQTLQIQYHI